MRSGLDSPTTTLYTGGAYDTHTRLKIENGSGTFISLENRYTTLSLNQPDPIEPIGSLSVQLIRDSTSSGVLQSLSPLVEGSDLNEDDAEAYSPLLQIGRQVTLDVNLTAVGGSRPSDGDSSWYEVFRGVVGKVNWPDQAKGLITIDVDGLGAVLQHAKSEVKRTYLAGTSLEIVVDEVLANNGFSTLPVYFPVATGKVLPNNWDSGLQKTVWSQLTSIAQSMGWVVYYRYRGQSAAEITFFEPARTKTVSDQTVEADNFKLISLDDAEIRNVGFLVYVDTDSVEQMLGPDVNSASVTKYGGTLGIRRPFWIKLKEDSPIRAETEAQAMLTAALSDVADPDVVANANTMPLVFGESGIDLYTIPARNRFFDTDQKWALFSNNISFAANADPRSSIGLRGVPTAGTKSWRDLSASSPLWARTHPKLRAIRVLHELPTADKITVSWNNNSKVYATWAYLASLPQPIDDEDEPWPTGSCPPDQVLIGTDTIVIDRPATGYVSFLQLEPRSVSGECGDPVRLSFDPPAVTIEVITPTWEITTESEGATLGTFKVKLHDPDGVMDDIYYRTKVGTATWTSYGLEIATPIHLDEYERTVAMVQAHPAYIEFRGRYTVNGVQHTLVIKSSGFDLGQIAGGSFTPSVDSLALTASASAQGDVDTTSWKMVAQTSGVVAEVTVDAATPIVQRSPTPAEVGSLVTGLTVGQTVYFGARAIGPDGNGPLLLHQMTLSHIPPNLSVSTESESGSTGTFAVALSDPSGIATALDHRTKSGAGAWSGWVSNDASPTVGESPYSQDVGLVEGHLSFIAFRLTYVLRGNTQYRHLVSGGFDIGQVATGSFIPVINRDAGTVTASAQGDIDTTGWKIKAKASSVSTVEIDAVTTVTERSPTVSQVGTLLSGLTPGDTVYFGARAIGDTNGPYLYHEITLEKATPRISVETESEDGTNGTFVVRLSDPDGAATKLESRTKSGDGAWSGYGDPDTSLLDDDLYTRTVTLVEGHLSFVQVLMSYALRGQSKYARLSSAGFDIGGLPNIAVSLTTDETGVVSANVQGDSDTASIRLIASKTGQPSDEDTSASGYTNGRMFTIGSLATLAVGETCYVTAFAYGASGGGVPASTESVKVRITRPGEFKPEVQVREVRTDETSVVTIDVEDTFLRITAVDFKKREGADGGATLSPDWIGGDTWGGGGWYAASGTLGVSKTLSRTLNVAVADGTEGEVQWRVIYTDVNGVAQTFGDTLRVVNLAGTSRSIVVPYSALQQDYPGDYKVQTPSSAYTLNELRYAPGYAFGSDNGYAPKYASVLLPPGVTITKMTTIGYRQNTGDSLVVNFYSFPFDGSVHTGHGYTTHDTTGWQSTETVLDVDVATDRQYVFYITMRPDFDGGVTNTGIDVRVASMKFDYTRPAYSYSY